MLDRRPPADAARAGAARPRSPTCAQRVFDAAVACDYETLEEIALEKGEGFTFSYGGTASRRPSSGASSRRAERAGRSRCARSRPSSRCPTPATRRGSYAWPTAYQESPTDEDWQAIVDAGLYTQEQVDQMKAGGTGYLGYRTAITADGDWQFFVAGD